jgi:hypothetical protein
MDIEGGRSIEIAHLGEGIDANVNLSSAEGRMKAVPYVILSGPRVRPCRRRLAGRRGDIAEDIPSKGNRLIQSIQEQGISCSRGSRLLREARDVLKTGNGKHRNGKIRGDVRGSL